MISKETINELRVILKEDFGLTFCDSEVEMLALKVTGFFTLLAKLDAESKVR